MRTIEITTTQKVTIEYELATLRDRILAFFMDQLILLVALLLLLLFYTSLFGTMALYSFYLFVGVPTYIFYTLVSEILMNGQTLGKRLIGIKVVKLTGKEPTTGDYATRWAFRLIDIFLSVGAIAMMLISSSNKAQRLGGITSNTTLIRIRFSPRFRLQDIERISSLDNYTPTYPQVRELSEQDMLLIKNIVSRTKKYPNAAHQMVMEHLVETVATILQIDSIPTNRQEFLKTLIRDYIVLTR